ncbi:MAG: hypothetical protein AAF771_14865 [Pseudomonadota bacterium]
MGTSEQVTVDFATHQAIADLVAVARMARPEVVHRVAAGAPDGVGPNTLETLLRHRGCRMSNAEERALSRSLVLAAALPNDDPERFFFATAVLLADRLQHGGVDDDLYWHWDAFRGEYGAAPAPMRAAIMQGYYRAEKNARVRLDGSPTVAERATLPAETVADALRNASPADTGVAEPLLLAVLGSEGAGALAGHWADRGDEILTLEPVRRTPLLAGFRYLYETADAFRPFGGEHFPLGTTLPRLPAVTIA